MTPYRKPAAREPERVQPKGPHRRDEKMITSVKVRYFDQLKDGIAVGERQQFLLMSSGDDNVGHKENPAMDDFGLVFDRKSMERAVKSAIHTGQNGNVMVTSLVPTSDYEAYMLARSMADWQARSKGEAAAKLKQLEWISVHSIPGKASGYVDVIIKEKSHLVLASDMLAAMENLGR